MSNEILVIFFRFTMFTKSKRNMKLSWLDAAERVLENQKKALHYTDIARIILENEYLSTAGPTPHQTINSILNTDINKNKDKSRFVKVGKGE